MDKEFNSLFVSPFPPAFAHNEERVLMLEELVANLQMSRAQLASRLMDERRDINKEAGYPETRTITPESLQDLYEREAIATRVVEVLPSETWKVAPTVYEDEDADTITDFETAWDELGNGLRGESHYKEEEGSPIWEYLERVDILSGIGQYGVILLGLDDGGDFSLEVKSASKLLYLRVFPEYLAKVVQVESSPSNPRYGMPTQYQVTFNDTMNSAPASAVAGVTTTERTIHWTRIIHVADNLRSSEVFGTQRLRAPLNKILDLRKVFAATGEGHWQQGFSGLAFQTDPALAGRVKVNKTNLRDEVEKFRNGLQRDLFVNGVEAKTLGGEVTDSSKHIDKLIEVICIVIGVPVRIFKGSERGELASSQDAVAWENRLRRRRRNYVTPRVIIPLVDRLILLGVLPAPKDGYQIYWPDGGAQGEAEKVDIALKKVQALVAFLQGNGESGMTLLDFYTRIFGLTEEEAQAVIEAVEEAQEEKLAQADMGMGGEIEQELGGVLGDEEPTEEGQPVGTEEETSEEEEINV